MPPKDKTSSIIIKKINALAAKVKDIENAIVETIVDSINMPRPKDGRDGRDGKNGRDGVGKLGKPGKNIKGDKGDRGDPGLAIKGDRGDKGDKGDSGIDGSNGNDAKDIQLRSNGFIIQWKSEGEEVWKNLFAIPQPSGAAGGGGGGALSSGQVAKSKTVVVTEITFPDSPYTVLPDDERIYVDAETNNPSDEIIIVNLRPRVIAFGLRRPIHVQKTKSIDNIVNVVAAGTDTINNKAIKQISSIDVDHEFVPTSKEWRLS